MVAPGAFSATGLGPFMSARPEPRVAVHAVLLAAGGSRRLGRPKQLVRLEGLSLVRRAVDIVSAAQVDSVTVVLGAAADEVQRELAGVACRVAVVHNDAWERGMGSSIRRGLCAADDSADPAGFLFVLCDQ